MHNHDCFLPLLLFLLLSFPLTTTYYSYIYLLPSLSLSPSLARALDLCLSLSLSHSSPFSIPHPPFTSSRSLFPPVSHYIQRASGSPMLPQWAPPSGPAPPGTCSRYSNSVLHLSSDIAAFISLMPGIQSFGAVYPLLGHPSGLGSYSPTRSFGGRRGHACIRKSVTGTTGACSL